MASIKPKCPVCNEVTIVEREEDLRCIGENYLLYHLKCGHDVMEAVLETPLEVPESEEDKTFHGNNGFKAFDYQKEGVKFIEKSNFNCLLADEMGLGKTPQALLAYKRNKANLTPTIVICKASLHINWAREYMRWVLEIDPLNNDEVSKIDPKDIPFIHPSGDLGLVPGFNIYLLSMDMLAKKPIKESIHQMGVKCIIVDECHNFKAISSKRTQALMEVAEKIPHKIMLSGTPILNKTLEYFPTLNIIKPFHFPTMKQFAGSYLDWDYHTKRWLGFTKYGKDAFFKKSHDYILRREVKDVQKDLPEVFTQKHYISDFNATLAKEYNRLSDELELALEDKKHRAANGTDILGIMTNLRHLTGLMKVPAVIEHVKEFMESSNEKLCIGIHHKLVRQMLMNGLAEFNPIELSGDDDGISKDKKVTLFKEDGNRLMIANILAGGEGLNMQFCNNALIMERQWNPGKEDQFIKRFNRFGQKFTVFIGLMIAADTIDDFFEQLLELKRRIVGDSLDEKHVMDRDFLRSLASKVVSTRLKVVGC